MSDHRSGQSPPAFSEERRVELLRAAERMPKDAPLNMLLASPMKAALEEIAARPGGEGNVSSLVRNVLREYLLGVGDEYLQQIEMYLKQ